MEEQFHFFTYGKGFAPGGWYQKNYPGIHRFYLITGGEGRYRAPDGEHAFRQNRFYLFAQNLPFEARQNDADPIDHLYFDFTVTPPLKTDGVTELPLEKDAVCASLAQALEALMREEPRDSHLIEELFALLFRRFCRVTALARMEDRRLETVLRYIHGHCAGCLTNAKLAGLVHLEENYFIRVFQKELGVTPHRYVLRYRLNTAVKRLAAGACAAEAAEAAGFADSASLGHTMKREMGCSPSRWKSLSG